MIEKSINFDYVLDLVIVFNYPVNFESALSSFIFGDVEDLFHNNFEYVR